ncbi:unnamed protein product [Adineta steineri]|uniref:Egal-1 winged helix domain-containing protein n=1 Tax=Adineta steineri TaxID=433720 RepID=A0A813R3U9_9BILA|nr:unnamed protein product [Adineta steineri]CAF3590391.1 unnamed protein product [Adineta steineri]
MEILVHASSIEVVSRYYEERVAHQAILFILDVLIRNNQAMPIVKLYDSFADRTFTPQMLRAVGGNEQGLQQFLFRYPSLFTVNNDTVSANSATPVRTINSSKSHHTKNKSTVSSASTNEANDNTGGTDIMTTSTSTNNNETVWDAKTMREIEQEAINFFKKQLSKREEEWLPIVSVAGHASQASADVRKYVGPQNEFKIFLSRYPNIFVVREDFCGLRGKADIPGVPFPPPSPPPKRRLALLNNNIINTNGTNLMLTRSTSFKAGTRPIITSGMTTSMNNGSVPSTPTSTINPSMLLSSSSSSSSTATIATSVSRNSSQRLTPNEVKAVHYVMRLLHKNGHVLLQNVPGLIARAPDHLVQTIGFTREDLITFFKRHNAIFQLHIDGTVSVKSDAARALLNKTDNTQISPTSISLVQSQQSTSITAAGVVIRIFPKYGILNMDNNEQVFFDIQSCHFETFNDLTCVLNPGDTMNFNAILGPKEGSTKWKSLKTWPRQNNRPAQLITPISSSSSSHIAHSTSANNLSLITSGNGGYISPPSYDHYSTNQQYQNSNPSNGYAPIDQDLNAYQMSNDTNGGLDESIDNNNINGNQSPPPMSLINSTGSNRHSRLCLPPLDEEQCPLPKMAGGLDAEVLRRNLQQVARRKNAISLREQADETGRYVSQGCQTTSTGEILATNIHIE